MPPAKIATTIKTVLKHFLPSAVNLEDLQLPGHSCASYMRKQELTTVNIPNSDKINFTLIASSTSDSASTQKFHKLLQEEREKDEVWPVKTE